eukprot:4259976-Prymnesium_polylepis.1
MTRGGSIFPDEDEDWEANQPKAMTMRTRTKEGKKAINAIFLRPPKNLPFPGDNVTGDGGVCKQIIEEGEGTETPPPGARCRVHYESYTMWNNKRYDSSLWRDTPLTFTLQGKPPEVLRGWDAAIATMKRGEIASVCCRSDYAYGWEGKPPNIKPDDKL